MLALSSSVSLLPYSAFVCSVSLLPYSAFVCTLRTVRPHAVVSLMGRELACPVQDPS